jgi:hypothetical protein
MSLENRFDERNQISATAAIIRAMSCGRDRR